MNFKIKILCIPFFCTLCNGCLADSNIVKARIQTPTILESNQNIDQYDRNANENENFMAHAWAQPFSARITKDIDLNLSELGEKIEKLSSYLCPKPPKNSNYKIVKHVINVGLESDIYIVSGNMGIQTEISCIN